MIQIPRFKSHFKISVIPDTGVFLVSETEYIVLKSLHYRLISPLIDGNTSAEKIAEKLEPQIPLGETLYVLEVMEEKGYIVESEKIFPFIEQGFWDNFGLRESAITEKLETFKVGVEAFANEDIGKDKLIQSLESFGIQVSANNLLSNDFDIILVNDYLNSNLKEINRQNVAQNRPWMLIKPVGRVLWIAPIFNPGVTGCWECLTQRLEANRPVDNFLKSRKEEMEQIGANLGLYQAPIPTVRSTLEMGLNLGVTEFLKWLMGHKELEGKLLTFDTLTLEIQRHTLTKRPQCNTCGKLDFDPSPIFLESRKKIFTDDGGHRCLTPEQMWEQYQHHISPFLGAVRGMSLLAQSTNLTPTYIAGHNFAGMKNDLFFLEENIRGRSSGKGKTDAQARASALGEALERYSGVFQGYEVSMVKTFEEMGKEAIHPNKCMLFSENQYQTRHDWNRDSLGAFNKVPEPFDVKKLRQWTAIWSLTGDCFKYLPTAYCYYGHPESSECWADSNGTAAGNTLEEAILQGFMELVERDAVAVWWYNRLPKPPVDLDSFNDSYLDNLRDYYQSINRDLWVLDLSSDLGIPAFAAISSRLNMETEDLIYGFGAHFDARLGIMRAITELNQVLPLVLLTDESGNTEYYCSDELANQWWKEATLDRYSYLAPSYLPAKKAADYPQMATEDLRLDIEKCVQIAKNNGLETLVLNQTRPDIGLSVVKVVVPGLRHFWKRWEKGRLYDVPVKLGDLKAPYQEQQLNSFPIFL